MPYSQVMPKFGAGTLHSGGSNGPVVNNQKQAVAIMLSEKAKAKAGNQEYQAPNLQNAFKKKRKVNY